MQKQIAVWTLAAALVFPLAALAQKAESKPRQMEAVVMVSKLDPATRTAYLRTRRGQTIALQLPPDTNLDTIKEGSRYRVQYSEAVVTAVEKGASAAAGATRQAEKTGPGMGEITAKRAGVVESVDSANDEMTLRSTDGNSETFKLGSGVDASSLKAGEAVTVTFQRAVATALRSTPAELSDPHAYNP